MLRIARPAAVCCVLLASSAPLLAAQKSFLVRGRQVTLTESPDVLLVRPKGQKAPLDVATQSLRAQAKVLDQDSPAPLLLLARRPAQYVKVLGGVLVPKLEGLRDSQLADVAAAAEGIESVHSVYRVGDQHVVPLETVSVRFKGSASPRQLFALATELDLTEVARPKGATGVVRFEVPAGSDPFAICAKAAAKNFIAWAEPDLALQLQFYADGEVSLPDDPLFARQWHMQPGDVGVQVPEAWALSRGTSGITVAIIDSGIDLQHPDLKPNLVAGYDFVDKDDTPQPDTGDLVTSPHGTMCAGMAAAVANNGRGIAGPAPNAKIMPVRIAGSGGFAATPDMADSLRWAAANGAKILSCSWGGPIPANQIADAIDEVTTGGAMVFVAAGNSGPAGDVGYPAQFENAIAVGATTREHKLAEFSSFTPGKLVDLSAPGADVLSSDMLAAEGYNNGGEGAQPDENGEHPGDYHSGANGTSFACPLVAGVAALVWSSYPSLTNAQMRAILQETAVKLDTDGGGWQEGYSDRFGYGQISAVAAMRRAAEIAGGAAASESSPPSNLPDRPIRTAGPASAHEVLEQLLKLRREVDDSGRPKFTKDLPDPKTVLLRRDQLADVLEPRPQSYFVRGHEVQLTPSKAWFVMSLDDAAEMKGPQFWQLVRTDATDEQLAAIEIAALGAGRIAVVAPREVLRARQELEGFARGGTLPAVYAAYEQGNFLLVPLGTISLRMKKDAAEAEKREVIAEAAAIGLRSVKDGGDIVRFAQTQTSAHASLFTAVAALAKLDGVQWCEPDFASRPLK